MGAGPQVAMVPLVPASTLRAEARPHRPSRSCTRTALPERGILVSSSPHVKPQKGQVTVNATNFPRDQLKVDWDFIYKTHSIVSHNVIDTMKRLGQPQTFVGLELHCDEKALKMALNSLTFTLWTLLYV